MHVAINYFSLDGTYSLEPQNPIASEETLQIGIQCVKVRRVHWVECIDVRWQHDRKHTHVAIANWTCRDKTALLSSLCFMNSDNCSSICQFKHLVGIHNATATGFCRHARPTRLPRWQQCNKWCSSTTRPRFLSCRHPRLWTISPKEAGTGIDIKYTVHS